MKMIIWHIVVAMILLQGCHTDGNNLTDNSMSSTAASELVKSNSTQPLGKKIINGTNVYSPKMIKHQGKLRMYFGGWHEANQYHDAIYVADCYHPHMPCINIKKVIDPVKYGFEHLNDPSIVLHPNGYYIMYMTGLKKGLNGFDPKNHNIYYATSWDYDGLNWSAPAVLVTNAWLPDATIVKNQIQLFYNDTTTTGTVIIQMMGTSGISKGPKDYVHVGGGLAHYLNVDVIYRPSLGFYQILAENAAGHIDYLQSYNGYDWELKRKSIITPDKGQIRVNAPSAHPDTHAWVYYGQTPNKLSIDYDIYFKMW